MNKLFNKIAVAFVGMAMAIGVGVAVGTESKDAIPVFAAATESNASTGSLVFTAASGPTMTQSGNIPTGASASFTTGGTDGKVAYNSSGVQLMGGGNMKLTFTSFTGYKITSLSLTARSNSKAGTGALSFTVTDSEDNVTTLASITSSAFNTSNWNGSWSTSYVTKNVTMSNDSFKIRNTDTVELLISASVNSIYIGTVTVGWEHAVPTLAYSAGGTEANLTVMNGSTNSTTFVASNFDSVSAGIFSNTPNNTSSTKADLSYSVSGTTVTVTATGKAVGNETFTISATGGNNTLTLNITVQASTTFKSLAITTPTSATSFNDGDAFSVTGMVVTATFVVSEEEETTIFSGDDLSLLDYTVNGNAYDIGDELDEGEGEKTVVVSYTDAVTSTTKTTSYTISINTYSGNSYTKVTANQNDWRGTYLLLATVEDHTTRAFNGSLATLDANNNYATVSISTNTITVTKSTKAINSYVLSIGKIASGTNAGKYYLKTTTGKYIGNTTASNSLKDSTSDVYPHNIEWDSTNGCIKITSLENATASYLSYNSGGPRFRYMTSYDNYKNTVALFKLNDNGYIADAGTYASTFLSTVTCGGTSGVNAGTITNGSLDWDSAASTSLKSQFNALSVDAQGYLANLAGNETDGATGAAGAMGRYDYIIKKYKTSTYSDFITRFGTGTINGVLAAHTDFTPLNGIQQSDSTAILIVVISLVGLTAIGGYFLIRRRKEQ